MNRHTGRHLLPPSASPLMVASSLTSAAARDTIPYGDLPKVFDPWECPARLLPWLATVFSVDLWSERWDETKKRRMIANAIRLHRLKGTLAGLREYIDYMGGKVVRAITPPGRGYLRAAVTEEDRTAWLESLPSIRIFPFVTRAQERARQFLNGPAGLGFTGRGFLRSTRGPALIGRRAEYHDGATVVPCRYSSSVSVGATTVEQILVGARRVARQFYGHTFYGRGFSRTTRAPSRVFTVALSSTAQRFAIQRGLEPVDVRPERIFAGRIAPAARAFMRGQRGHGFLKSSHGAFMIYDRIAILDPERAVRRRKVRDFYGRGRWGIPKFTAELRISIPMHRSRMRAGAFYGVGYLKRADMTPLWDVVEAVHLGKSRRDVIKIDTNTHRPLEFNSSLRFGEFNFGDTSTLAR